MLIEVVVQGKDQASAVLGKVGGAVSGLGSVAAGVATGGLALAAAAVVGLGAAAVGATVGVISLAKAATEVEGTRQTFETLTKDLGGSTKAIKELQIATRGMVSEADLMAASNKFLTMGITENLEETEKMAEMATQLGLAMGTDATQSMEDFALMMANMSIPRLDTFGISSAKVRARVEELTKATDASGITQAEYDKGILKSTRKIEELKDKLTLAGIKQSEWTDKTKESTKVAHAQRIEKITRQIEGETIALENFKKQTVGVTEATEAMSREEAFKIAVMEQGGIAMERVGEQGENAAAMNLRWQTSIADLKLSIGQAFVPALESIRRALFFVIKDYGPKLVEWANIAGEWLGEKVPIAIEKLRTKFAEFSPKITKWANIAIEWTKKAAAWLGEKLPLAIEKLRELWTTYWPMAQEKVTTFWEKIQPALIWIKDTFQDFTATYLPALRDAWDILREGWDEIVATYDADIKPALEELWEVLDIGEGASLSVGEAVGKFLGWLTKLAASGVIEYIKLGINLMVGAMEAGERVGYAVGRMIAHIKADFERIQGVIDRVKIAFENFKNAITGFELPWWLTPGSPTPLETGLLGIEKALAGVQGLSAGGLFVGGGGGGGDFSRSVSNQFNMTVNTGAGRAAVQQGFATFAALA